MERRVARRTGGWDRMKRPKLSGAISGNHGLRYPYCAEILDTQAALNDAHVKCPKSNGHSLRVIVLNRMRCDRPQSASSGRSHQWDEFFLSGRPVIAWMPVRGCSFM